MKYSASILVFVGAAYLSFGAAKEISDKQIHSLVSWVGEAPVTQYTEHVVECMDDSYEIKFLREKTGGPKLIDLRKSGEQLNGSVLDKINEILAEFKYVKGISFSCGKIFENTEHPEFESKDFTGTLSVSILGRSIHEKSNVSRRCFDQGHYYDDEVRASIIFRGDEILKANKPNVGVCITGIGPAIELKDPQLDDGAKP